ncbi:MAG: DUF4160 domain-containing protein [Aestuariivirga sp.]
MPTISIFFGIVVQMYWRDHPPPHFHAYYQGFEGLFSIETGELIAGQMPPAARRILKDWINLRRTELLTNWELCKTNAPLNAVPGADEE